MVLKYLLRAVSALVAGVMILISGSTGTPKEYDVKNPSSCLLNFTVISDSHIESNNLPRLNVLARSLKDVRMNRSGNDAVVFLGDNTMNGQTLENMLFYGSVDKYLRGEKILPVVGNHDIGNGNGDYGKLQNRWYTFTNSFTDLEVDKPYYYQVIDGYYFIVIGPEMQLVSDLYMSDEQLSWLEDVLRKASGTGKPAFLFSHYPTDYLVDEEENPSGRLVDILAEYASEHDLFCFVGHTHMPMFLFWSFDEDNGYPEILLPRITDLSGSDDEPYDETGVGVEVEIYENEVLVRARDFYRSVWKYDEVDETMCEMTYTLGNTAAQ